MRGGKAFFYLSLVLVVLILLNLPLPFVLRIKASLRDNVAPLRNALALTGNRVRGTLSFVGDALRASRDQERLLKQLAEMRLELWHARELEQDNRALRRLVDFRDTQKHRLVLCEEVSRGDASGWWETITLNRGWDSGITTNQAVITPDGLVGRTLAVTRQTCDVLLVTDPGFKVAGRVAGVEASGIIRGMGIRPLGDPSIEMLCSAEPCQMDYVSCDVDVAPGAEVRTSGLGGVYPEGIPVGRVRRVARDVSGLYQRADIEPAANLKTLRYVFVVVYRPEG